MKSKRILFINVTYKNASTGRLIDSIMSSPEAKNVDYKVLFQQGDNEDEHSFCFETRIENIVRRATHKFFGNLEWVTIPETRRLIKKIEEYNPDIIHIHTIHHQCTNYLMLFKFLEGYDKPVIISVHDCWVYTGGCYHYTQFGCRQFETGCQNCTRDVHRLECKPRQTNVKLEKKCGYYNSAKNLYFVGVSEWICNELRKSMIKNPNITCIKNGVDTNTFRNKKNNIEVIELRRRLKEGRKYLILGVANAWGEGKGLSRFAELAGKLGNDYQIVLVGGGLPKKSPIGNLKYYGLTYNVEELVNIYNAAELLVNLSLEESFGLVSVEAAACGTKVIGFDSTANTEVIQNIKGILVKPGDYLEVETKIREFFSDADIQKCEPDEEYVLALSKQRMAHEYWKLYGAILRRGNDEL